MVATNRIAAVTGSQWNRSALVRIVIAAMQVTTMLSADVAARADQPKNAKRLQSTPTIEIVPQQEVSGERISPMPPGADVTAVKPLRDISFDVRVSGQAPPNVAVPSGGSVQTVGGREVQRGFADTIYFWQASNMVHRPLYYEQRYVERYGANFGPMQPIASGVQFAADTALLPAKMLVHPPCECVYSLGYGRPGSSGTRCPRY